MTEPSNEQRLKDYWSENEVRIGKGQLARYPGHINLANLPINEDTHFRGFLSEGESLYGKWGEDWFSPPTNRGEGFDVWEDSILCHVKPMSDRFCGVPDRWDLFVLLRSNLQKLGMRTEKETILISRTEDAWLSVEKLMKWERDNHYRRKRLEKLYPKASARTIDIQYAESAIRGVMQSIKSEWTGKPKELNWPSRPLDRQKHWSKFVRALGLTVDIKPIPFRAKLLLKSDRSVEAQISRFLYQGVDMIQDGKDFHQTLKELGCTPRNIFSWLKRQRPSYRPRLKVTLSSSQSCKTSQPNEYS